MRFEAKAALAVGILLPVLETCRRGLAEWAADFTTMITDYFGGALLLLAAWAAYKDRRWAAPFLLLSWGWVAGMLINSFADQLEGTVRGTIDEPHNALVLAVKFLLSAIAAAALVASFRRLLSSPPGRQPS